MSYKLHSHCLNSSLLFIALLFFQSVFAQLNPTPLKTIIDQSAPNGQSLAVLVTNGDSLLFEQEQGDMKLRTKLAIGESSQWLTAAVIMTLVDQGKLSLDDKVKKYIPIFESYGKSYITLRDCLAHTTGIKAETGKGPGFLKKKKPTTLEEAAETLAKTAIANNPGEVFHYSPAGYVIAARIAEIVSRRRFDMLARTRLFVPTGMRYSSFSSFDGSAPDPFAGAISTPEDYVHFLQMLLHNGSYNGKQVLSEASVTYLFKIQTLPEQIQFAPTAVKGADYASGAWVLEEKDHASIVLAAPAFTGPYPLIDRCRGYGLLVFVEAKEDADAPLSVLGEKLRQEINTKLPEHCSQ